jgi:putative ABC transport system substrate-binding protein
MNNRRRLLIALGTCASVPGTVCAQTKKSPAVIGFLGFGSPETGAQNVAAFKEGLAALGWKEGAQFVMDVHWAESERERLPPLIEALAKRKPAVIVTGSSLVTSRVAKAVPDIPIVQSGGNPVQTGLAKSFARPGDRVTGISNLANELNHKLIELLVDVAPTVKRVGILTDAKPQGATVEAIRQSAARYAVEVHFAFPAKPEEIESAIFDLAKNKVAGLIALASPFLNSERARIIAAAQAQRWPIVSWTRLWVEQGALLSYGVDSTQNFRRAAYFVDRILKGAKPGDLPIEQPMHFELAVNMKAARALGVTIPPTVAVRATHVIQ